MKGGNVMAQVVARYINEHGGLDGHPVQVVVGDAGGDPARALSLVRDMVENKGVIALMGNLWVFSANGPRDYLEEKKIPVIGGDGTTQVWIESPMYFPSGRRLPGDGARGGEGPRPTSATRSRPIIYCAEAEQCGVWRDTARANARRLGVEIVYEAQVSLAQPDFTAECIQAQRNGATGIQPAIDGPSIARFGRVLRPAGLQAADTWASAWPSSTPSRGTRARGPDGPAGQLPVHLGHRPRTRGVPGRPGSSTPRASPTRRPWPRSGSPARCCGKCQGAPAARRQGHQRPTS